MTQERGTADTVKAGTLKFVYDFAEGRKGLKDLLGGKGANLAEMTNLGLPVPPGFTITTQACQTYLTTGTAPSTLDSEVARHLTQLETALGRTLGGAADPLLVSVRSGAKFSMPGMMETILNIGLCDASLPGLARQAGGNERFALDSYRRLIAMFGHTVCAVPDEVFADALDQAKQARGTDSDLGLDAADLRQLVATFKEIFTRHTGRAFPQEPQEQLRMAIEAVFRSWRAPRAVVYRQQEHIPDDLGTAVNVQAMVFGNLGPDSGTGVAFTRDPATGAQGVYGDYLSNAQGEDVVAGIRNTVPLQELERLDGASFHELLRIMSTLEKHYTDLCDIEFTIERSKLWMLQTRVGKRTPAAAFVIAAQLVDEGLIDLDEGLRRVTGSQLAHLMFPTFDHGTNNQGAGGEHAEIARGVAASPGAAVGRAVFDSARAAELAAAGERVILVRRETNPDDLPGLLAARGVLTSHGGKTSHAAVVARGLGKTCVCGAETIDIDYATRSFTVDGLVVKEGELLSVDGTTGRVYEGEVPVRPSAVVRYFEGEVAADADPVVAAVHRFLTHADARRRLGVHANADTPADAQRARRFGAAGIGLCRTEHMFLGDRRALVEHLILAHTDAQRQAALAALLPLQRADFVGLFRAMDGYPVTIRLIDPPLHEFLPALDVLASRVAVAQALRDAGIAGHSASSESEDRDVELLAAVRRIHEENPMMGLRGVRLSLVIPGLLAMQVRAIAEAAALVRQDGGDPRPEIMVPLVGDVHELAIARAEALSVVEEVARSTQTQLPARVGTMIEVPRAALTSGQIAQQAEFFSFGTNDLTQLGWGFSRDDVEGAFFSRYLQLGIFSVSPFESIDVDGIGRLIRISVQEGRAARPDLQIGVCGEHGGDPGSVRFFDEVGLDYVSCSPFRVPVARLEAGRAVVLTGA